MIICLALAFAFSGDAHSAGFSSPAQDDLARLVEKAGTLKNGMSVGLDTRVVVVLSVKEFTVPPAVSTPAGGARTSSPSPAPSPSNLALKKPAKSSSPCASSESADKAFNGSVRGGNADKWCSLASSKFLEVDLGSVSNLTEFVIRHASEGGEPSVYNTKDFDISVSADGRAWTKDVSVSGNRNGMTRHATKSSARYVRLNITTPTQSSDRAARIYEFEVYGTKPAPAVLTVSPAEISVSTDGKPSATVSGRTVKLGGVAFKAGDVIQLKFTSPRGSWTTPISVGNKFQFITALPVSPVTVTASGSVSGTNTGAEITMSKIDVKYMGVEFMTKCEWTVEAGSASGMGLFKFIVLPGSVVQE